MTKRGKTAEAEVQDYEARKEGFEPQLFSAAQMRILIRTLQCLPTEKAGCVPRESDKLIKWVLAYVEEAHDNYRKIDQIRETLAGINQRVAAIMARRGASISPEAAAAQIADIDNHNAGDPEGAHKEADALMCEVLGTLGYGALVDRFRSMKRWYS